MSLRAFQLGSAAMLIGFAGTASVVRSDIITTSTDPLVGGQLDSSNNFISVGTPSGTSDGLNHTPAAETPNLAFDGISSTKYLNFGKTNTGVIITPAFGTSIATSMSFNSANDATERNPTSFSLYGSNSVSVTGAESMSSTIANLSSFSPITLNNPTGYDTTTAAFTPSNVSFSNTTAYKTYLLVFPDVANNASANSMQIGDALINGTSAPATPEPSSLALVLAGGIGLLRRQRRTI